MSRGGGGRLAVALSALVVVAAGCRRGHRPPRSDGAPVVVLEPSPEPEPGVPTHEEVEPNSSDGTATPLALGGATQAVALRGSLGPDDPLDVIRVAIAPDPGVSTRRLTLLTQPSAQLAMSVEVRDGHGGPLVSSQGSPGERHGAPNLAVEPGATYLLKLRAAAGAAGRYVLSARIGPFEGGEEREPNDAPERATPLPPLATAPEAAGLAGWPGDQDWFRVPLPDLAPGAAVALDLDPVPDVAFSVALHDLAGQRLVGARGKKGARLALRGIAAAPLAAGSLPAGDGGAATPALLVQVRAEEGRSIDRPYVLRLRAQIDGSGEAEPNDEPARAARLGPDGATGHLLAGDVDLYRLEGEPTRWLTIEATPPRDLDVELQLVDARGAPLARRDAAGRGAPEILRSVTVRAPLFLRLSARRGQGNADEPYRLTVTDAGPAPRGGETEPNDREATAAELAPGLVGMGTIAGKWDTDQWIVRPAAGAAAVGGIRVATRSGGAIDVTLRDPVSRKKIMSFRTIPQVGVKRLPRSLPGVLVELRAAATHEESTYELEVVP